jgi:hypothetical protein
MNSSRAKMSPEQIADALRGGLRVAPSRPDPWAGTLVPGSPWTRQQLAVLAAERKDPATVNRFAVAMERVNPADWGLPPEKFDLECPQLARTRSGRRVLIVTPSGDRIWRDVK